MRTSSHPFVASGVAASAIAALVSLIAASGCSQTAEGGEGASDKLSVAESDLKVSGAQYLGRIANGETRKVVYSAPPAFRALGFEARGGDSITVSIKSEDGDAMGWITDSSYNVLAANDDESATSLDSRVTYTVPKSVARRTFRIVMREYDHAAANLAVTLAITPAAPPVCEYDGKTYQPNTSFPATDGCNTCSCGPNGGVPACTKMACPACNPASETNRNYLGTPTTCMTIRFTCQAGWAPFQNACGCGCERVN